MSHLLQLVMEFYLLFLGLEYFDGANKLLEIFITPKDGTKHISRK